MCSSHSVSLASIITFNIIVVLVIVIILCRVHANILSYSKSTIPCFSTSMCGASRSLHGRCCRRPTSRTSSRSCRIASIRRRSPFKARSTARRSCRSRASRTFAPCPRETYCRSACSSARRGRRCPTSCSSDCASRHCPTMRSCSAFQSSRSSFSNEYELHTESRALSCQSINHSLDDDDDTWCRSSAPIRSSSGRPFTSYCASATSTASKLSLKIARRVECLVTEPSTLPWRSRTTPCITYVLTHSLTRARRALVVLIRWSWHSRR